MSPLALLLIQLGLTIVQNAPAEIASFAAMVSEVKSLLSAKDQASVDTFLSAIQTKLDADLAKGIADANARAAA